MYNDYHDLPHSGDDSSGIRIGLNVSADLQTLSIDRFWHWKRDASINFPICEADLRVIMEILGQWADELHDIDRQKYMQELLEAE